eukprot:g2394.t1
MSSHHGNEALLVGRAEHGETRGFPESAPNDVFAEMEAEDDEESRQYQRKQQRRHHFTLNRIGLKWGRGDKSRAQAQYSDSVPQHNASFDDSMMMEMSAMGTQPRDIGDDDGNNPYVPAEDEWPIEKNIDLFFGEVYHYFEKRGWVSIVAQRVVNIVTLGFTIVFSVFMLEMVDWSKLTTCKDEATCGSFSKYIDDSWLRNPVQSWGGFVVFAYFMLFALYWVWNVWELFWIALPSANKMHKFYSRILKIEQRELYTIEWDCVVQRIGLAQEQRRFTLAFKQGTGADGCITPLEVALRLMRKENYLVAMMSEPELLDMRIPGLKTLFVSRNLEFFLHHCLLNAMFNDRFQLRDEFRDPRNLSRRFFTHGVFHALFLPFMLIFMLMQFFMKHAQDWHSKKSYLGPRMYSSAAMWQLREYNELPHVLEHRLGRSYKYAIKYLEIFQSPLLAIIARGVMYISGAVVGLLLVFALLDDATLLYVHLWDRQLLFFITLGGGVFAGARVCVPSVDDEIYIPENTMIKIASHTHYFPKTWRGKCHTLDVRDQFDSMFQFRAALFFGELLSVIWTPWILCVSLPRCSQQIVRFVIENSTDVNGIGTVCKLSTFDFEADNSSSSSSNGADGYQRNRKFSRRNKIEKSLINFQECHPNWSPAHGAATWLQELDNYAQVQTSARAQAQAESLMSIASSNLSNTFCLRGNLGRSQTSAFSSGGGGSTASGSPLEASSSDAMSASVKLLHRIHTLSDNAHENNFFWHEHRSVENDGNETLQTHAQQAEHEALRHQHERPQQQVVQIISAAATDEYNEV